ncbi:MAG: hypothetical protein NPIRA02_31120 [Nitrospirales bacterium]|nr:MAG: hypothetical protein NPIRA02_31120 [Nitrospirales bacterium]
MQTIAFPRIPVSQGFLVGILVMLTIVFFLLDVSFPLGVAGGVLYVTVVLVTVWFQGTHATLGAAIVCTCMIVLGYLFSSKGGERWTVIVNRMLSVYVIWVTAVLMIQWKNSARHLVEERSLLRQIVDMIPQWVFLQSSNGQILFANQAMADSCQTTVEQLMTERFCSHMG